jgi:hypothetical protein
MVRVVVVGAEEGDDAGDAAAGQAGERERRDLGLGAGLAAAAGEVDVEVDEAGDQAAAAEVGLLDLEARAELGPLGADPRDATAGHEQVARAPGFGGVESGVGQQLEHVGNLAGTGHDLDPRTVGRL